jgi:hypothetical protein
MKDNTRVKIFTTFGTTFSGVEREINNWIEHNPVRIIDIKHCVNDKNLSVFTILYDSLNLA